MRAADLRPAAAEGPKCSLAVRADLRPAAAEAPKGSLAVRAELRLAAAEGPKGFLAVRAVAAHGEVGVPVAVCVSQGWHRQGEEEMQDRQTDR